MQRKPTFPDWINNRYFAIGIVTVLSILFWFAISLSYGSQPEKGIKYDDISKSNYNMTAINDDKGPNPYAPYFVGFDVLRKYGSSRDDIRYIRDTLTNFTLYKQHTYYTKISLVSGSYTPLNSEATAQTYRFTVFIDGKRFYVQVSSDIVTEKILISISNQVDSKPLFNKSFDIYSL